MLILSGGGVYPQTKDTLELLYSAYERLNVLYVPQARESQHNYSECVQWLVGELNNPLYKVTLLETKEHYTASDYDEYDMLYIGGGNIERLLSFVRSTGFDEVIESFIEKEKIIMGGSAGAIIFGKDCRAYRNYFRALDSYAGFGCFGDVSFACHYTPDYYVSQFEQYYGEVVRSYSSDGKSLLLGLPEHTSLIIDKNLAFLVGGKAYLFDCGNVRELLPGERFSPADFTQRAVMR